MPDAEEEFPPDHKRGGDQPVQRGLHRPFGGIFDRNDPPEAIALLHRGKDLGDGRLRGDADALAEMGQGGLVAEGGLRSQEGYGQRRLERTGGGDDLPEDLPKGALGQNTPVVFREIPVDSLLPGGIADIPPRFALDFADLDGDGRPLVEEPDDLRIQPIDFSRSSRSISSFMVSFLPGFPSGSPPERPRS